MITTLVSNTYKAVKAVYFPVSKFPKEYREFPIMSTVKLSQSEGKMTVTAIIWDDKKGAFDFVTETIPARVDTEFETLIPARQFRDWLHATLPTKEEKKRNASQQINFTFDPITQTVSIRANNTRATFKCIDAQEFPC